MVDRDSWGHSYLTVRGEILGFVKDGLLRKHLPRMFSLGFTLSRSACCRRTGMRRMSYGGGYGPKNMQNKSEQFIA